MGACSAVYHANESEKHCPLLAFRGGAIACRGMAALSPLSKHNQFGQETRRLTDN